MKRLHICLLPVCLLSFFWLAPVVWLTFSVGVLAWTRWAEKKSSARIWVARLLLLVLPFSMMERQREPLPSQLIDQDLIPLVELETYFNDEDMLELVYLLEHFEPQQTQWSLYQLLVETECPQYISLSVLNLNQEPLAWRGQLFAHHFRQEIAWTTQDGRVFLSQMIPVPSQKHTSGYLVIDMAFASSHGVDEHHTWMGVNWSDASRYRMIDVPPQENGVLRRMSRELLTVPAFDVRFIPKVTPSLIQDILGLVWVFVFLFILAESRHQPAMIAWLNPLLLLLALFVFPTHRVDHLDMFGSHIFGSNQFGRLFSTPLHLTLTTMCLFLLAIQVVHRLQARRLPVAWLSLFTIGVLGALVGPTFIQEHAGISLTHPVEALRSPGAFLTQWGFLTLIGLLVYLMSASRKRVTIRIQLLTLVTLSGVVSLWHFGHVAVVITAGFIWMAPRWIRRRAPRDVVRAALAGLLFYPMLFEQEQIREVRFVGNELMDEITLLNERNHFRVGRVLSAREDMTQSMAHPLAMKWLAKRSGLLHEDVAFALQLRDPRGRVVSKIENHISLDQVPVLLFPHNRIEIYQENRFPRLMVYRTEIEEVGGLYELAVVLGNDFHNLSLVRQLRTVGSIWPEQRAEKSTYFAYLLDVYDLDGRAVFSQLQPGMLDAETRLKLDREPLIWTRKNDHVTLVFRDQHYYYRITHKKTPLKMVLVRYIGLVLLLWLILKMMVRVVSMPVGLLHSVRRSFGLQFAGVLFLGSILPTLTLGYFMLNSINRNQSREAEAVVRAKIQTAKNVLNRHWNASENGLQLSGEGTRMPLWALSQMVGENFSLFLGGSQKGTTQPELFRSGELSRRLPFAMVNRLNLGMTSYVLERVPTDSGQQLLTALSPIQFPDGKKGILEMTMIPESQRQRLRWREQIEFGVVLLLAILFIMAHLAGILAQRILLPIKAITRGATRLSRGQRHRPIAIDRQDELQRMVEAFNTMLSRVETSQAALQRQLNLFDVTLQSMNSGVVGADQQGRIIVFNRKVQEILSLPKFPTTLAVLCQQCQGLSGSRIMQPEGGGEFTFTVGAGASRREVLVNFRALEEPGTIGIRHILVFDDVTHAMEANRFKAWSEMARRVAHEIKNPLTPIQLEIDHIQHLHRQGHPNFARELDDSTQQIRQQISQLRQISSEFADYARPVTLNKAPIVVAQILRDIIATYQKTLPDLHFDCGLNDDLICLLDHRLMRRAFHNLIENAVQAMESKGTITIRMFREKDDCFIQIQDTGPGISEEDQQRVFEAYFSTKDQGTGLGLAIARKTVERHGGTLFIDPHYRGGTRFVTTLPLPNQEES